MKEAEEGKISNHILMSGTDTGRGIFQQIGKGSALAGAGAVAVAAVIVILAVVSYQEKKKIEALEAEVESQKKEIEKLTEENTDLVSLREELTDKVMILSDTINQKVEEEEAEEQEKAQAHMPVGFPMSSSTSLEEAGGDTPMVKLNGGAGTSIIASADGTVVSITTDSTYIHCIKVDHGNGYHSIYRNDGEAMVKEGDAVVRGAILYVIGEENTELGYQITYNEKYIDPMELINVDG